MVETVLSEAFLCSETGTEQAGRSIQVVNIKIALPPIRSIQDFKIKGIKNKVKKHEKNKAKKYTAEDKGTVYQPGSRRN